MNLQQRRLIANALSLHNAQTLPITEQTPIIKYQDMSCRKAYSMFDSMPRDGDGLGQEQQEEQFQLAMTDLVDLT